MKKSPTGFWEDLQKPIMVLAPMADVTDVAFREMFAKYGKPDILMTEFVSTAGLTSRGRENLMTELAYTEKQRPIVAQIFGPDPDQHFEAAKLCKKLGFDGIDINMGCPDKKVCKQDAGAALIEDPKRAQAIIQATIEGGEGLPVSVKTRAGFNKVEIDSWIPKLLEAKPVAITLHCRTKKELSKVPANWDLVKQTVDIAKGSGILILGNGDVTSLEDAHQKAKKTGADGVMVGRGAFGNPLFFNPNKNIEDLPLKKQFAVMVEHTKLFEKLLDGKKNFNSMKKHYRAYVSGFEGAKELRMKLMQAKNAKEVEKIVKEEL